MELFSKIWLDNGDSMITFVSSLDDALNQKQSGFSFDAADYQFKHSATDVCFRLNAMFSETMTWCL